MLTKHWHVALAVVVVAGSLVGGLIIVRASSHGTFPAGVSAPPGSPGSRREVPPATDPDTPSQVQPPTITPKTSSPIPKSAGPAVDTVHVADRYRERYNGRYVGWDDLLADGKKLPEVSRGCRSAWKVTSRDASLDWGKATYLCLEQLSGIDFKPQGIAGTGTARSYTIGGRTASERNIVAISSYSRAKEKGLLFPNQHRTTNATRLTVIDFDRGVYNQVELVRVVGPNRFAALNSHGSGFAWVGQYMYSSSLTHLWMYNADDLMEIDGHYVLPAVGHWRAKGAGGLSSIGVDRSSSRPVLTGVNFNHTGTAWSQSFDLDAEGRLHSASAATGPRLTLTRVYGPGPTSVVSTRYSVVPGSNFQGIGRSGPYGFVNSSSLKLNGRRHGDNLVILKRGKAIARFTMPRENMESVYIDYRRSRYVTVTEYGRQFLFWLPLDYVINEAER